MDPNLFISFVTVTVSAAGAIVALIALNRSKNRLNSEEAARLARIELKTDTMWRLMFRGGVTEGLINGLFERNSPLRLNVHFLKRDPALIHDVETYYLQEGKNLHDLELMVNLEARFGRRMQKIVESSDFKILPAAGIVALLFHVRPESDMFAPYKTEEWSADVDSAGS